MHGTLSSADMAKARLPSPCWPTQPAKRIVQELTRVVMGLVSWTLWELRLNPTDSRRQLLGILASSRCGTPSSWQQGLGVEFLWGGSMSCLSPGGHRQQLCPGYENKSQVLGGWYPGSLRISETLKTNKLFTLNKDHLEDSVLKL